MTNQTVKLSPSQDLAVLFAVGVTVAKTKSLDGTLAGQTLS